MSIRAKITLWVLVIGLSEAVLLGLIGYHSVQAVSRNAGELRRIGDAIQGARVLNASLFRLSDPSDLLLRRDAGAPRRFTESLDDLERQVGTCAATSCHGYRKRPPRMAAELLGSLEGIRDGGLRILSDGGQAEALPAWVRDVDEPARKLSRTTAEMSDTLMARAKDLEASSRETEHTAVVLVVAATLLCAFTAVVICMPLARGIARPLETLAEQARRIAGGDLDARADEKAGSLESSLLARSFNRMLDDLARRRSSLLERQDRLERTVEERVQELRRKDAELKRSERMASVGLVAGTVAHDLNNPLTNILLNAETLLGTVPAGSTERRIAQDILDSAERCRKIAWDIRNLGREAEIERVPCDVPELAREAVQLLKSVWEPRRITVRCDAPSAPGACLCNGPHLLQAVVNLVDNAVHATPEGGEVEIRVRDEARGTVLEVEDHGPGIPPKDRASLFRPFFTTKPNGTGLGLALCKRVMERHEGGIEVESRTEGEAPEGRHGTLVRLVFPPSNGRKDA